MTTDADITFDVNVDVESHRARPQTFGTPPEAEGDTAGSLYFGETPDEDDAIHFEYIAGPPGEDGADGTAGNSFDLPLGDEIASDGISQWTGGAVTLHASTPTGLAIAEINKKLALAASADDLADLQDEIDDISVLAVDTPLGDEVATDGLSLWDDGAVTLRPSDTVGYALSKLNHKLQEVQASIGEGGGGPADGFHLVLGDITANGDGSWAGAVPLEDDTSVSQAVDLLNTVLGKLVPSAPPAFPSGTLSVANSTGSSPRLADGATDNSGTSTLAAGDAVTRITAAGVSSNVFNDVGPGNTGTLSVLINGVSVGSHALSGSGDNGNYNGLVISDQKDFPVATPGFWKSVDVALTLAAASVGINKAKINHTAAGATTDVYFVRDNVTAAPTVSAGTASEYNAGTYAYSSSVPHYDANGEVICGFTFGPVSGQTYYGGADPIVLSGTNAIATAQTHSYVGMGFTVPLAAGEASHTIGAIVVELDGTNVHNSGVIQATAKNVNGSSGAVTLGNTIVHVKRGSAAGRMDENSVTVSGLGSSPNANNAVRVSTDAGDKPAADATVWDSTASLASHEATVVGGVLLHDQNDYSSGLFIPLGPDLSSGRSGAQYATFSFNRSALSAFKIAIAGSYAGCWIRLPGVSDEQPNGGGWWNAFQSYDGSGVPGETGDTVAGCALGFAMTGASGTFQITFGTESSTHATDNEIQVRIKLTSGQSVTSLSLTN